MAKTSSLGITKTIFLITLPYQDSDSVCCLYRNKETADNSTYITSDKTQMTPIYDEEIFLNLNHVIYSVEPDDDLFLEIGRVQYRFQIQLPPNLPTSFAHRNAFIRYSAKGVICIFQ